MVRSFGFFDGFGVGGDKFEAELFVEVDGRMVGGVDFESELFELGSDLG